MYCTALILVVLSLSSAYGGVDRPEGPPPAGRGGHRVRLRLRRRQPAGQVRLDGRRGGEAGEGRAEDGRRHHDGGRDGGGGGRGGRGGRGGGGRDHAEGEEANGAEPGQIGPNLVKLGPSGAKSGLTFAIKV